MGLVDKFTFEKQGARGCSDSDYTFAVSTCCGFVGVVDDELHDFYWDPQDLGHVLSVFQDAVCPACRRSEWDFNHIQVIDEVPEPWRWACQRLPPASLESSGLKLKTVALAPVQNPSLELAAILKAEFGWLDSPPDILRMLNERRPLNVVEHIKPGHVRQLTEKLEALGLQYRIHDES